MIVFVHGPDATLARDLARAAAVEADPSGENTSWLDGREVTLQQIIGAVGTISFFGGRRVVVVSDFLAKSGGEGERANRANAHIAPLVSAVPDGSTLILIEPSLSSPPAALKSAVPQLRVLSGAPPRGPRLLEWIAKAAQEADSRMDRAATQALAEALFPGTWQNEPRNPRYDRPPDLGYLRTTIETLALAAYPDPITVQDVAALSGDVMVLPRVRFDALGGFDPGYATAIANLDLCRRARVAGMRIGCANGVQIIRMRGQVTRTQQLVMAWRRRLDASRYLWRNGSRSALPLAWACLWSSLPWAVMRAMLKR